MSAETEIREVLDQWLAATTAKDAAGVVRHMESGNTMYSLAPPLVIVNDGDTSGLEAWFATWRGPIGLAFRDLTVETGGDIAYAYGFTNMTATTLEGEDVDLWYRQTIGLKRIGGSWKIVHQHESVPFYMDGSFRAAVDLRP